MAILFYWMSHQPSSIRIRESLVHEVDVIFDSDPVPVNTPFNEQKEQKNSEKRVSSSKIEGQLPKDIIKKAVGGPKKKLEALKSSMKHKTRESAMLERMEKSLMREAKVNEQEILKLPKPQAMLAESQGPVSRIASPSNSGLKNAKLLVIARENSGFPVLGQFFTRNDGFFEHGEPPLEVHVISNLLNCVLTPEIIETFPELVKTGFGTSPYFKEECLLDSQLVCNDPLSYERSCAKYPHQILHSKHFSLKFAKQLLQANEDLKIIFLVRDPRGTFRNTSSKPHKSCSDLSKDLDEALNILSEYPKHFALVRYEVLAISPRVEVSKLLENLEMEIPLASEEISDTKESWSLHKNSVHQVNKWKQQLSAKELQKIENQCLETLSKLEYQLLGQGVA